MNPSAAVADVSPLLFPQAVQRACLAVCFVPWLFGAAVQADESRRDAKAGYHLFHRTPAELRRDLSTDRPDRTESAYTVDAGWFQIEGDVTVFAWDRHNIERAERDVEAFAFLPLNLKAGLTRDVDLQVIVLPWLRETVREPGLPPARTTGFGDVLTRVKWNLWGNDGGTTALAVMPYAKWPAAADGLGNGAVEGGLILPFSVALPAGFTLGAMTQFDLRHDDDGDKAHAGFINTITVSRALVGELGAFVEFFSDVESTGDPWAGTFDLGFTFGLTEDIQLDAGVVLGLTRAAPDVGAFAGFAVRF